MPLHWPGYRYLGPGTNRFDRPARNSLDAAARRHDKRYKRYGRKAYLYYNKADEEFLKTVRKERGLAARVSQGVFELKKRIAPSLPEKDMSRPRSRGRSTVRRRLRFSPVTPAATGRRPSRSPPTPMDISPSRSRSRSRLDTLSRSRSRSRAPRSRSRSRMSTGTVSGSGIGRVVPVKQSKKAIRAGMYWNKHGIVYKTEAGGVTTDAQCLYLGHSTVAQNQFLTVAFCALAKSVLIKFGYNCRNIDQIVDTGNLQGISFQFTYRALPAVGNTATTTTAIVNVASVSIATLGTALLQAIRSNVTGQAVFYELRVWAKEATDGYVPRVLIDLQQYRFAFSLESFLKVQNATEATTNTADPNKDVADDVMNNPLIGYLYKQSRWGNYLEFKGGLGTSPVPLSTADPNTGIMVINGGSSNTLELRKPPTKAYQVGCNMQKPITVQPGDIVSSKLVFKTGMGFNRFMLKMENAMVASANNQLALGNSAIFGLEKVIAGLQVGQSPVTLQWQVDNIYRVSGIPKTMTFTADANNVYGA